ncbi:MAG TPA: tripartite tricarboxylate transporter substrate binding protein [Reyranellaceae bacterium]|nr:tripartite tricarboxylate transporter substrate binding protein [Reyranellaceae bacterium]
MKRRSFVAATVLALPFGARAQDYPNKPIKLLIPWAPGGSTDQLGRILTVKLSEQMGQPWVIENKPGATGTIGHAIAARSAPDGYNFLFASNSTFSIASHLYKDLAYDDVKSFVPVSWAGFNAQILSVHPSVPAKSYAEFVALAKAKPGEINFSTAGVGATSHLATELLMSMAGIRMTHVPYKGGDPSLQALLAGETKMSFVDISSGRPHFAAGKLRPLATSTPKRISVMPDLPTIAESGLAGFESMTAFGMWAPAGTPGAIVERVAREIDKALATEDVKKVLGVQGVEPVGGPPSRLAEFQKADTAKWGRIIKERGIKFE